MEVPMIRTVIGSFDNADDADRATRDLRSLGFPDSDINLVVSNVGQGDAETELPVVGDGTGPVAKGAVAGGVLGGAAGLAASLAGLALPGIGPILTAGPIVATLAAAGAGAVAGGVVGKLTHLGGEGTDAGPYAETLERGGTLVTLRTDESRADEVSAILRKAGAIDVARRDEDWRATGSTGNARARRRGRADRQSVPFHEPMASSATALSDSAWVIDQDSGSLAGRGTHIPR
jgi:hypothetical protein